VASVTGKLEGGIVAQTIDRRKFLTHSAATVGGVAIAGTVVDTMLATSAFATTGDNHTSTPKTGGTLRVGIGSEVPDKMHFTGSTGKLDSNGFCIANAVYDALFVASADGKTWLPNLAVSATPDKTFKVWTIKLRQGVSFHDGTPFTSDAVVANYNAAKADTTVGLAIQPLIASVTKVDTYTVNYTVLMPWTTFPWNLSEQQIGYMADPGNFTTNGRTPNGTGPFKYQSWTWTQAGDGDVAKFVKNTGYWKKDAAGRSLPYLDAIEFHVVVDANSRYTGLKNGTLDLIVNTDGQVTYSMLHDNSIVVRTDENDPRDPSMNSLICNMQTGNWTYGAVDPSSNQWVAGSKGHPVGFINDGGTIKQVTYAVVPDLNIRKACAEAINRAQFYTTFDRGSIGHISDGIFRTKSAYYSNPKYPAFSLTAAKASVSAWQKANKTTAKPVFVIDTVQGSTVQDLQFAFVQQQLAAAGIDAHQRKLTQPDLIQKKISKQYDMSTWSQFGGVVPDINYVWFQSSKAFGNYVSNFVNFAQQADPVIEAALLAALAAPNTASAKKTAWSKVNAAFAVDLPYLWLDTTLTAWAANPKVMNFAYAAGPSASQTGTGMSCSTQNLSPDGGSARWEYIWLNA
jgi:peptide/nickel transport system substrate-binding protein